MPYRFNNVRRVTQIGEREFVDEHLHPEVPVLISGFCAEWEACRVWSPAYFRALAPALRIPIKSYRGGNIDVSHWTLGEYTEFLFDTERTHTGVTSTDVLPYCHDIPLFAMM